MSSNGNDTKQSSGGPSEVRSSGREGGMRSSCCGWMGDGMRECPCVPMMRRHPVISSTICVLMGLVFLAIPVGAVLGIIAFLMSI